MTDDQKIPEVPRPSMFLFDPLDREQTRLTQIAHRGAQTAVEELFHAEIGVEAHPVQFVQLESGEMIVWEVHGQSSVTGHGKQGLRPERLAFLRGLDGLPGISVLFDFVEGVESYRRAWLHDLPEAQALSHGQDGDAGSKRFGWPVSVMEKCHGRLLVPSEVPEPRPLAQPELV